MHPNLPAPLPADMSRALWILGYFWALPTTLLGFALALLLLGWPFMLEGGAVWIRPAGPWSPLAWWWARHFGTLTLGGCVITGGGTIDDRLVRHELRHFAQARVLGPLFVPVYLLCSLWALVTTGDGYWGNALEVDARRYSE